MFRVTRKPLHLYQHVCYSIVNIMNHMRISAENKSHCQIRIAGRIWAPSCVREKYFYGSRTQTNRCLHAIWVFVCLCERWLLEKRINLSKQFILISNLKSNFDRNWRIFRKNVTSFTEFIYFNWFKKTIFSISMEKNCFREQILSSI